MDVAAAAEADRGTDPRALGAGLTYHRPLRAEIVAHREQIGVLELIAEHFIERRSRPELAVIAATGPCVVHALEGSLGTAEGVDKRHLRRIAEVVARSGARWWSDHIAFTRAAGRGIGHLVPLPRTDEALRALSRGIEEARRLISAPLLLETIAAPFDLGGTMSAASFVRRLVDETGVGLVLDAANLVADARNHALDVDELLDAIPPDTPVHVHVAGGAFDGRFLRDTHAHAVSEATWALARRIGLRCNVLAITLERDTNFPPFDELLGEVRMADAVGRETGRWH